MSRRTITITVSGAVGVGKSAVALAILDALRACGLDATWADEESEANLGTGADNIAALSPKPAVVLVETVTPAAAPEGAQAPPETAEFRLRAMVDNYTNGHEWDQLDANTCEAAANEIRAMRYTLAAKTEGAQGAVAMYQVRPINGTWREVSKRDFDDYGESPGYPTAEWERRKLYTTPALHEHAVRDLEDAERYRWLRGFSYRTQDVLVKINELPGGQQTYSYRTGDELDAAVDHAKALDAAGRAPR